MPPKRQTPTPKGESSSTASSTSQQLLDYEGFRIIWNLYINKEYLQVLKTALEAPPSNDAHMKLQEKRNLSLIIAGSFFGSKLYKFYDNKDPSSVKNVLDMDDASWATMNHLERKKFSFENIFKTKLVYFIADRSAKTCEKSQRRTATYTFEFYKSDKVNNTYVEDSKMLDKFHIELERITFNECDVQYLVNKLSKAISRELDDITDDTDDEADADILDNMSSDSIHLFNEEQFQSIHIEEILENGSEGSS